jgi:hypothetical protein
MHSRQCPVGIDAQQAVPGGDRSLVGTPALLVCRTVALEPLRSLVSLQCTRSAGGSRTL